MTKALVTKKHKDATNAIIGSKEAYRIVVTQASACVEHADTYFPLCPWY